MNIIIVSYIGSPWLQECLESIKDTKYPVFVAMNTKENNCYETTGLLLGKSLGDPFVLMHDSMIIKDIDIFNIFYNSGHNVSFGKGYLMYFGKYNPNHFGSDDPPIAHSKKDAVHIEMSWCKKFAHNVNAFELFPEFTDIDIFEEKHNRKRMVLENKYVKKYKNCWDLELIEGADKVK
jgi:hypothetical protein